MKYIIQMQHFVKIPCINLWPFEGYIYHTFNMFLDAAMSIINETSYLTEYFMVFESYILSIHASKTQKISRSTDFKALEMGTVLVGCNSVATVSSYIAAANLAFTGNVRHPTEHFTVLEPEDPSIDVTRLHKPPESTEFEA